MKISIITVCFNSEKTISDTINSVNSQSYKNIEHIFVDGGSKDQTLKIIQKNPNKQKKVFIKKKSSIYEAMNEGIKRSSGEIIQILNSDDIFHSNNTIEDAIKKVKVFPNYDIYLGNVVYFDSNNFFKIKRFYVADNKKIKNLINGSMPPHPASLIRKSTYQKCGLYNTNFKIASDFDFFYRAIIQNKLKSKILNQVIVRMRTGGASDQNIKSYLITSKEVYESIKKYNPKINKIKIYLRGIYKIKEIIFFNQKKLNKNFELFNFLFNKDFYYQNCFKIIKKINLINFKKNFILSGMNLAFLGYYSKNYLYPKKSLIHWPDGIFVKKVSNVNKIPGRDLIKNIKIPKNISTITVLGNITNKSKDFLKKKFFCEINHISLPYAPVNNFKKIKLKIRKNDLILITLPTPKQEMLAYALSRYNKHYKIICIGGSISIASGEEKQVPKILQNYEFIWRLKNDFFRRIIRLVESLLFYIKGKYITKLYNKTIFKVIEK
jgi:glycosyltransferase involved in cell wall biosynthesis